MKILTVGRIIFRIALIIAAVELFIMLVLGDIPHRMQGEKLLFSHLALLSFLNAVLLVFFASPLIYFWVVKPFADERDAAISKITLLAHHDPLTHLANRRLIDQNLKTTLAHCIRRETYGALILIDLDSFKPINDNHGHDAGDAILIEVAKRLTSIIRDEDVVGRIGGDEFVVLINYLDKDEQIANEKVLIIAEKLNATLSEPLEYAGKTLQVNSSAGISLLGMEKVTIDTVFKRADLAMYQAKKGGKKYIVFSQKTTPSAASERGIKL